ncbi:porin [uncultured Desulfobacter sp.]|uniref:porin n=1 Tax=uncultured Desulfobacter sp. TaxID=240139 RepID=UPI0029F4BFF0|nr:porin [uncultured Desulfobacter sp.]
MKKLIVAVAALALMAGSAYATEWNFYGESKIYTGWADIDRVEGNDDGDYYDTHYSEGMYANSKIGANIVVSDELTAKFEYGTGVDVRYLYGAWNFGSGTLLVGQSDTPINVAYSNQLVPVDEDNDLGLGGYGDFDNSRNPELMLTFGGFSIAFLDPDTTTLIGGTSTQAIIPMIAMCYKATFDMGEAQIAAGYDRFEIDDDEDIDAYAIGLGTQLNFGAVGMFATFVWGENIGNLGAADETEYQGLASYVGGEVYDCETIGGTIGVTFAVSEMLTLEAGYGYIHDEIDDVDDTSIAQSYYLQAGITLAPGVTVTPEVGMIDNREDGCEETMYFGATWAIAF